MKYFFSKLIFYIWLPIPAVIFHSCDLGLDEDSPTDGKMMFWSNFDGPPIDVYVSGDFSGTITTYFSEPPDCETSGCVTVTLVPGTYQFYAEEQTQGGTGKTWSGSITIRANVCGTVPLAP